MSEVNSDHACFANMIKCTALPERAFQQLLTNPEVHHALAEHATSHLLQDAGGQPNFDGLPLSLDSILSDLGQLGYVFASKDIYRICVPPSSFNVCLSQRLSECGTLRPIWR
eukprot:SAG31_NODE_229_length_19770_cov_9.887194_4_plen_112_part_00